LPSAGSGFFLASLHYSSLFAQSALISNAFGDLRGIDIMLGKASSCLRCGQRYNPPQNFAPWDESSPLQGYAKLCRDCYILLKKNPRLLNEVQAAELSRLGIHAEQPWAPELSWPASLVRAMRCPWCAREISAEYLSRGRLFYPIRCKRQAERSIRQWSRKQITYVDTPQGKDYHKDEIDYLIGLLKHLKTVTVTNYFDKMSEVGLTRGMIDSSLAGKSGLLP